MTKKLLAVFTSLSLLSACGGDGGDDNDAEVGYLTFNGISGLSYETASQSGTTGPNGEFRYYPGETVTFRLGDLVVAENVVARRRLSPLDLEPSLTPQLTTSTVTNGLTTHVTAEENAATQSDRLTNWFGFLIALDNDLKMDNGIQITEETLAQIDQVQLDEPLNFTKAPLDFGDSSQTNATENRLLWSLCFPEEFAAICENPIRGRRIASEAVTLGYIQAELNGISSEIADNLFIDPFALELAAGDTRVKSARLRLPAWAPSIAELEVISSNPELLQIQGVDPVHGEFEFFSTGTPQTEAEVYANVRLEGDYRWTPKSLRVQIR